ncbi:N-acetylmannosamine-6-phosphate 2-epimerase [Paenibacillus alkaliterrae]|uniref:N-acetylmannosamine-6-phosphate 2-epimerase n=1 Tax=Paenibacillus alkaliterrae TaxID=320909 RepID=UPI001F1DDA45|nr:N-acetylmannosamine-6-phosphate 2-epimerase [Paenibacillus alkaliterrae]MCF2939231.1 N-acetylmannosamine-6-phosphate 2-epimerase [Paenibacillus alkaliterrae]
MTDTDTIESLKGKLIVSCQALEDEPLYDPYIMAKMALAAKEGGASAIRANSVQQIQAIKKEVDLPIIGIIKRDFPDSDVYITPTLEEITALIDCGVDIIAMDFTNRTRPHGVELPHFIQEIKKRYPKQLIMADISTFEEGVMAEELGADLVSTTLSGYTPYSRQSDDPDLELIQSLKKVLMIPIVAEGRIYSPETAAQAIQLGAHAVVVGGAITRPREITKRFVAALVDSR